MFHRALSGLALTLAFAACGGEDPGEPWVVQSELASPAGTNSGEPFLTASGGEAWLTWLEASASGGHDFRLARLDEEGWSEPTTIAHGDHFFVNWADFPSVTRTHDGALWAHWLERGGVGTYDYGVRVVHSTDGGDTWSEPYTPHDDASPTEHGFVSTVSGPNGVGFAWLDGRRFARGPDGSDPTNEMTLRYRELSPDRSPGAEVLVDDRVCDCCQTAAALTDAGPVIAYRNRTDDEVRDIYLARRVDGTWVAGQPVHPDGWEISGCPVNGPAVRARGLDVAVAWFTAAGDVPRVKVAFSRDAGATFGAPVVVDDGNPGGRVDLVMRDDGSALVTWLERTGGEGADVRIRSVRPEGKASGSVSLTGSSSARASGFPRIAALHGGVLLLAWTDVTGDAPQVRIARLDVE